MNKLNFILNIRGAFRATSFNSKQLQRILIFFTLGIVLSSSLAHASKWGKKFKRIESKIHHALSEVGQELNLNNISHIYEMSALSEWEESLDYLEGISNGEYDRLTRNINKAEDLVDRKLKYIENLGNQGIKMYTDSGTFVINHADVDYLSVIAGEFEQDINQLGNYANEIRDGFNAIDNSIMSGLNSIANDLDNINPGRLLERATQWTESLLGELEDTIEIPANAMANYANDIAGSAIDFENFANEAMGLLGSIYNGSYTLSEEELKNPPVRVLWSEPVHNPELRRYYSVEESNYLIKTANYNNPLLSQFQRFTFDFPDAEEPLPLPSPLPPLLLKAQPQVFIETGAAVSNGISMKNFEIRLKLTAVWGPGNAVLVGSPTPVPPAEAEKAKKANKVFNITGDYNIFFSLKGITRNSDIGVLNQGWHVEFARTGLQTSIGHKPGFYAELKGEIPGADAGIGFKATMLRGNISLIWDGFFESNYRVNTSLGSRAEVFAFWKKIKLSERLVINWPGGITIADSGYHKPKFHLIPDHIREAICANTDNLQNSYVHFYDTMEELHAADRIYGRPKENTQAKIALADFGLSTPDPLDGHEYFWPDSLTSSQMGSPIRTTDVAIRSPRGGLWEYQNNGEITSEKHYVGEIQNLPEANKFTMHEWPMAHGSSIVVFTRRYNGPRLYPDTQGGGYKLRASNGGDLFANGGRNVFVRIPDPDHPGGYYLRSYRYDDDYGFGYLSEVQNANFGLVCAPGISEPADDHTQLFRFIDLDLFD